MKHELYRNTDLLSVFHSFKSSGKYLFHGSPISGLRYIKRHLSYSYPNLGEICFLTPEPAFAACFLFNWRDNILRQGTSLVGDEVKVSLWFIIDPKKLNFTPPGSIYVVERDKANLLSPTHKMEYYSTIDIPVVREIKFNHISDALELFEIDTYDYNTKQKLYLFTDKNKEVINSK